MLMANHPAFEASERAVRVAQQTLAMDGATARRLVRGEISFDTFDEIRATIGREMLHSHEEFLRRREPLKFNGVSFYLVENLPVPWRVIGLGQLSNGELHASIVVGSVDAEVG